MENQSQNKIRITLKEKLMLIMLPLIIISLLIECMVIYDMTRQNIQAKVSEYMQQYLVQLSLSIDNELATSIQMNAQLAVNALVIDTLKNYEQADNFTQADYRENMSDVFVSLISIYGNIKGIYVFDDYGNEFYARKRYGQSVSEMKKMDWYQETLEKEGAYVIFLDDKSGADSRNPDVTIGIARSVVDIYTRETYGVVLIEIPYSILEDCVFGEKRQMNLEQGDIFIQNEDGDLIYATASESGLWESVEKEESFTDDVRMQIRKVDKEEIIQIGCVSEKSCWRYTYLCEMKYLMQDMKKMRKIIAILLVCMALVAGCIAVMFSNLFLRPLNQLVAGMKKVTEGDYDVRVRAVTQDEFRYLILTFNDMTRSIQELIQKVYQGELMQKEAQLEVLQQQINPHFLYNTLESIRGMALEENCGKIADMAKNMSYFMRYNMRRGDGTTILKEEKQHVTYYIRIINYRFNNKICLRTEIPKDMLALSMPKFTLQPVVENAVLHGLSEKEEDCEIIIDGHMDGADAVIEVSDNGTGIPLEMLEQINENLKRSMESGQKQQMRSVGIYNVNSRLKLNFGERYGVSISSEEGKGTVVRITFPVKKDDTGG